MAHSLTRRDLIRSGVAGLAATAATQSAARSIVAAEPSLASDEPISDRPFLTKRPDFNDVSRGTPIPHTLTGDALIQARLTPETWRLEVVSEEKGGIEKPLTLDAGNALTLPVLEELGQKHGVRYLKAMQCNNIEYPLGQGLWEGVPLREVVKLCGELKAPRRIYYWGFHNNDPTQKFQSSLAMSQVFDGPPGQLPALVAYRLNGGPIPLQRGGPVRMVIPWAHGFKSVKWLQKIVVTNRFQANDTYADFGNDPESYLKTAAYFDDESELKSPAGQPVHVRGTCMVGWPGLKHVEYWLRVIEGEPKELSENDPAWTTADWKPFSVEPAPRNWGDELPQGTLPKDVWGFDEQGRPRQWPLRFSLAPWQLTLRDLAIGRYELRVRTVDENGFAQPEPRTNRLTGQNPVQYRRLVIA